MKKCVLSIGIFLWNPVFLTDHNVIFPGLLVGELDPGADCVEVVKDHHDPLTEPKWESNKGEKEES